MHDLNNRLGIYIDSWDKHTYNIEAYRNIVHDIHNADGFTLAAESGGLLENVRIYNNIVYGNEQNGILVSENGGRLYKHPMQDIYITNNTFYKNGTSRWGAAVLVENPDADDVFIRNNICSQNVFAQIQVEKTGENLVVENNLIDGFRGYAAEAYGDAYVEGDPQFLDAANSDFHLQPGSPAIDAGAADGAPTDDYEGIERPQGAGFDIGAFEFLF